MISYQEKISATGEGWLSNLISSDFTLSIFGLSLLIWIFVTGHRIIKGRVPPGPPGLVMIIGNVHNVAQNPYRRLSELAKIYGKIYTIQLGTRKAVVVSDPKLMNEILSNSKSCGKFAREDAFPGRHDYDHGHTRGVMNTEGATWMEQRQFCCNLLESVAKGRRLEFIMIQEVNQLVDWIHSEGIKARGGGVNLNRALQLAVVNSLWYLVSDNEMRLESMEMGQLIMDSFQKMVYTAKGGLMLFPWLKYMAQAPSNHEDILEATDRMRHYIEKYFDEHLETYRENHPRDLMDLYIEKLKTCEHKPDSSFYGKEGKENCIESIMEVFISGGEAIALTLNFLLFYLAQFPKIQFKLWQEVNNVIEANEDPSILDAKSMPYLEAVIKETLRISTLAPLGVMHEVTENIRCSGGYTIPKGYLLIANVFHVHHNKDVWTEPDDFQPKRFMQPNPEKQKLVRENFVPFQAGKRMCPGGQLSMQILTVFVAKLVQEFEILPDDGVPSEDYTQPDINYLLMPKQVKVVMKPRKAAFVSRRGRNSIASGHIHFFGQMKKRPNSRINCSIKEVRNK